jgi:hypothetical protein
MNTVYTVVPSTARLLESPLTFQFAAKLSVGAAGSGAAVETAKGDFSSRAA